MTHLLYGFCMLFGLGSPARAAEVPLNFDRLIPLMASAAPIVLDDREMVTYQAVSAPNPGRDKALLTWFGAKLESGRLAQILVRHQAMIDLVGTTPNEVTKFVAESRLLFAMIRQRQPQILLDKQFVFWNYALRTVSFRFVSVGDAERWTNVLEDIFASALAPEDLANDTLIRIEKFFASRPELNQAVRNLLADQSAVMDGGLWTMRQVQRTALFTVQIASMLGIYFYALPHTTPLVFPESPLAQLVTQISAIGLFMSLYHYKSPQLISYLTSIPATYTWRNRRITTLDLANLARCRDLLGKAE